MSILSLEARRGEVAVKPANHKGNQLAAETYGVSPSRVKQWKKRWDGTWRSLPYSMATVRLLGTVSVRLGRFRVRTPF